MKKDIIVLLLLVLNLSAIAQYKSTPVTLGGVPTLVFAPQVDNGAKKPLLLSFHGNGEAANQGGVNKGINQLLANGLPKVLAAGFLPPIDYIIVCPQDGYGSLNSALIPAILDATIRAYNIDTNRIYLTGYSAGGQTINLISQAALNRIAAFVNISPAAALPTASATWFKASKTGAWYLGGTQSADVGYAANSTTSANLINAQLAGQAKLTISSEYGHGAANGFTSIYQSAAFWSYLASYSKSSGVIIPIPTIPSPTDPILATKASVDSLKNLITQLQNTVNAFNVVNKISTPLQQNGSELSILPVTPTQDGYMDKNTYNDVQTLKATVARLLAFILAQQKLYSTF